MSNNSYFNLHTKSSLLEKFLNDITDSETLTRLLIKLSTVIVDKLTIIVIDNVEDNVEDNVTDI